MLMVDVWKVIIALAGILAVAGAIAHAIARAYFSKLNDKIEEIQDLSLAVSTNSGEIRTLDRRVNELSTRLAAAEGGLAAQMRSLETQISGVNVNLAELRGQLNVFEKIRGLVGKRIEDKDQ